MPDIVIRKLHEATVEGLKEAARCHGRSMQAEARLILEEAVERRARDQRFWERVEEIRRRIGKSFDDSGPYFAEARERSYRDDDEE